MIAVLQGMAKEMTHKTYVCPECNGTGEDPEMEDDGEDRYFPECSVCHGLKLLVSDECECSICTQVRDDLEDHGNA